MKPITPSLTITPFGPTAVFDPQAVIKAELGRLIHAAVVNQRFRHNLLANPLRSIEEGFCGESFHFPAEFKERIQLIRADTLESFSMQVMQTVSAPQRVSEKAVLNYS